MLRQHRVLSLLALSAAVLAAAAALPIPGWTPKPVKSDPLVRIPGTQPDQGVVLEGPDRCMNCHSGYDPVAEPGSAWQGSMMAQAARDPLFWAAMTAAAQDSIWALGNPNATDLCVRCHFPEGWLEGRSDPTNAALMKDSDFDGVHCDFCHKLFDPFAETTFSGAREGSDWTGYWDEHGNTGPNSNSLSQTMAKTTYDADLLLQGGIKLFSGDAFFVNRVPRYASFHENGVGQYFVSTGGEKRASFSDATARHKMLYSRYHKSKYYCQSCHDVSNPALLNLLKPLPDRSGGKHLLSEQYPASRYYHVERTFSEFMLSDYGKQSGAATNPAFRQQMPGIDWAAKCQDCHMRDVTGRGADKKDAPIRPTGSVEHPKSGVPSHDLTGGNAWVSRILASLDPNGPVYDSRNVQILGKGPSVLTLDLNAGLSPKSAGSALERGAERATAQLKAAASIRDLAYDPATGALRFKVQNHTGHKLISGFPEGRRMFVNVQVFDANGSLVQEINPYADTVGTLRGLPGQTVAPLRAWEKYSDELVYEMQAKSDLTKEAKSFHFVLSTGRSKDNRIPPRGFDAAAAPGRLCEPVWKGQSAATYFTAAEYAGGYDDVLLTVPAKAAHVRVALYYQGTSREYVAFLRDEINGNGTTLPSSAYIAQTDPFFAKLKAWGNTIWDLWYHNHGLDNAGRRLPGIVPVEMTRAEYAVSRPNLYHTGNLTPGGTVRIVVQGQPSAPVTWAFSGDPIVQSPPVPIPGIQGVFYLRPPVFAFGLGHLDANGWLQLPVRIPPNTPRQLVLHTQALVGPALTDLDTIRLR